MLVIGNGESRKILDLDKFNCVKVGCNALYRDCYVRHLVCVDRNMVKEVVENSVNQNSLIYTRKDWFNEFSENKNIRMVPDLPYVGNDRPDEPIHWGSGPYAVLQATKLINNSTSNNTIHMIGFDLYGNSDNKINNIYKDTDNYELSIKRAVDPRYWIYQIARIFENFLNISFIIYVEDNWEVPALWKKSNVTIRNLNSIDYNIT